MNKNCVLSRRYRHLKFIVDLVQAVPVRLEVSAGSTTEVQGEELQKGTLVACKETTQELGRPAPASASPCAPQPIKPGGRSPH